MGRDITVVSTHPECENVNIRSIISAENLPQINGDTVAFELKPYKTLLFSKETGKRIRLSEN